MNEELIVYVWRYKVFTNFNFISTNAVKLELLSFGTRNFDSGPDFFNAKIKIGDQLWAGNVEIHVNSSDWYRHKHQEDKAYNNVILHVVYNHDKEVYVEGRKLHVLELKDYISDEVIENYDYLRSPNRSFLKCSKTYSFRRDFEYDNWIDSLFLKRLENKTIGIENQIELSLSHWEQVLFRSISKSFGLKLNAEAFSNFATSFEYRVFQKVSHDRLLIEALFFGQAGFLNEDFSGSFFEKLRDEYTFIKTKFSLLSINNSQFKFFRTRPANFPTIRLSQLASLYFSNPNLFSKIIEAKNLMEIKALFGVKTSKFWTTHYTFNSESKMSEKKLTDTFIDLIVINSLLPIRFLYFKRVNNYDKMMESIVFAEEIKKEKNRIISEFEKYGWVVNSAKESQALLELKYNLCDKNKCLSCLVGKRVISPNTI